MIKPVLALAFLLAAALQAAAQAPGGEPIPLDATLAADGRSIELVWQEARPLRGRDTRLARRVLGATGADSWVELELRSGRFIKTRDDTILPGIAYEYRVLRNHGTFFSAGYWAAGTDIPARQDQGTVFIALEESLSDALQPRLARLEDDLVGAGWQVRWLKAPRHAYLNPVANLPPARTLREQLRAAVAAEPKGLRHMILLLGHVPMVTSGRVAPDGHDPEPHVSDLFYGDMTGQWADDGAGQLIPDRLPDGRIELPVGRVDFALISEGDRDLELAYLRAYLDKTHHWRQGLLGDLRVAYGQSDHLRVERFDLRNIVGPDAITPGGHHDAGERQPWLWGVDFGQHQGQRYADYEIKPVFAINFGSGKQKIDRRGNAMTALLAQPFYTVAVAWGARPSWRLHPMALGRTIGEIQQITANNGAGARTYPEGMDYAPTGSYPWRAPIWVNLLGDPTLAAFPLAPPRALRATQQGDQVVLDWDGAAARYQLLRATAGGGFAHLATITGATRFVDENPVPGARYQLRALGKQEVYAGSFFTASQGIYARVGSALPPAPDLQQTVTGPGPHRLSLEQEGVLLAPLRPPETGKLRLRATGWHYLPEEGFAGTIDIALSASASGQTVTGRLRLTVRP